MAESSEVDELRRQLREARDALSQRAEARASSDPQRQSAELSGAKTLQNISAQLIREHSAEALYAAILDAAMVLMRADAASVQVFDPTSKRLRLLACRGFHAQSELYWQWVDASSQTTCGAALRTHQRVFISDIEQSAAASSSRDLEESRRSGFRSMQSTPLLSRAGRPLGMISTHWRTVHQPADCEFELFDVLVRQAADLLERSHAEAALRESEARSRTLLEGIAQAFWEADASGVVINDSPSWRAYTGQSVQESIGHGWMNAIHPDDRPSAEAEWREAVASRRLINSELRLRTPTGEYRWTNIRATPLLADDGRIEKWVAVNIDIDARRRAEQALRESEERQAFLLKLSDALRPLSDPFAVQCEASRVLREHMRATRVAYCEVSEDEFVASAGADHVHGEFKETIVYRLSDYSAEIAAAYRQGRTMMSSDTSKDVVLTQTQRAVFTQYAVGAWLGVPLVKEGHLIAFLAVTYDAAHAWAKTEVALVQEVAERTWAAVERARVEGALRASEERFRQFAEASSDFLWMRDAGTLRWEFLSPAFEEIYGESRDAALGTELEYWASHIVAEDRLRALEQLRRVGSGDRVSFEYRIQRPDRELRWIRTTAFPLKDEYQRIVRIGGIGQDITADKAGAERLRVLIAELQHRTRNIMAVVHSLAEKTMRNSKDFGEFRSLFQDRLAALARVQGLLSRLEEGDRVTFDELLRAELAALGANESPRLRLVGPAGVRLRSSTVQTLALALHELATNSAKYGALADPQGRLSVHWSVQPARENEHPMLSVDWEETGAGSASEDRAIGSGYGRELIERALPYQLGARTTYELNEDGVRCSIEMPISSSKSARGGGDG